MINGISDIIKAGISNLSNFEKIDMGISLIIIPVPWALELANQCLEDISEDDFKIACDDLITATDYFEKYETDKMEFIDESNYAIGLIGRYVRRITGRAQITAKLFREKFEEITKQIGTDIVMPWTEIELTTCGWPAGRSQTGSKGPSLEKCISTYKTDWCKKPELFNVEPNRPGIQIIQIPKTGVYEITAWGAGNGRKTASGTGFTNVLDFFLILTTNKKCKKKTEKIFSNFTLGAIITGKFNLKYGDVLHIGVGQKGSERFPKYGGGSGGTFICQKRPNGSFEPLVIAGGAGGDYHKRNNEWSNASINQFGNGSMNMREKNKNIGECGTSPDNDHYCYCGGAGYNINPPDTHWGSPKCFEAGLQGAG